MTERLPPGWSLARLVDIADLNPPNPMTEVNDSTLASFVPMAAVETLTGRLNASNHRPWREIKKGYTRFQNGDVLLAKITPSMENGKAALAKNLANGIGAGTTEFHVIRSRPDISAGYILHFIMQEQFRRKARARMTGTAGQLRVPAAFLEEEGIPLPPFGEQCRIVDAIENYFSQLDAAVVGLERAQAKLKAYRASVLKAAVEGRLVPTEAKLASAENRDYEPADVLLKRILSRREKGGKDHLTIEKRLEMPPLLPEGWSWATIDQLTSRITSGSRDWSQYYGAGSSVFLMAQNVRAGRLDLSFRQLVDPPAADPSRDRSQVEVGDLLVTIVGANTGQVARVPVPLPEHYVCQSVALMRPVEPAMSSFLDVYLNSPAGQSIYEQFMYGQGRPHLSFDQLRETPIALPPLSEQLRIVAKCEEISSVIDKNSVEIEHCLRRCRRLRQSILKWAFEGRLVGQDSSDEPASKLLERIHAECVSKIPSKKTQPRRKPKAPR